MARRRGGYKGTARQKAALKKAQMASAAKRKRGGKKKPPGVRKTVKAKLAYKEKNYKGPGAMSRRAHDLKHSEGNYATNFRGKPHGKVVKKSRRIAYAGNQYALLNVASNRRGKKNASKVHTGASYSAMKKRNAAKAHRVRKGM